MFKHLHGAALCLALAAVATPADAIRTTPRYTSLTVFGDSLVDAGNAFIFSGGAAASPTDGYFMGRFTNGYDYTDLLSQALFGTPTVASLTPGTGGNNYGFGGARATSTSPQPDRVEQLRQYQASGTVVDANGLDILNFGGNDIFAAQGMPAGPATDAFLMDAAAKIAGGVQALNNRGVRNIFLTDFPVASALSLQANGYLTTALAGLTLSSDTSLFRFNSLEFLGRVQSNPGAFGIAPFSQSGTCKSGGAAAIAGGCVGYFSFDGIHPVAAVQRALFQDADRQFALTATQAGAVPEPATWGMMILGFGMAGGAMRRRRATVAA